MTCPTCGAELKAGARFCGKCGNAVDAAPAETAPVASAKAAKPAKPAPAAAEPATPATPAAAAPAEPAAPAPLVAPWPFRRKLIVGGAALAALLVVAALAVGIGAAVTNATHSGTVDASAPDELDGGDDTPVQEVDGSGNTPTDESGTGTGGGTDTTVDQPVTTNPDDKGYYFASPSGNIRCLVTEALLMCRQGDVDYQVPSANCSNLSGTTIGLTQAGVTWPCLTSDFSKGEPVALDTPIRKRGYTCSINFQTGITCTNKVGQGFTMEYHNGVRTF